jgi:uncharacterized membrane protein
VLAIGVALVALVWVILLTMTPWLPGDVAVLIYGAGSFICHQLPERSFHLGAFQLPVCARCLGIYAGVALCASCWVMANARRLAIHRWSLTPTFAWWTVGIAALPTVVTVGLERIGAWPGSNGARAVAGAALGIGVALVVMTAVDRYAGSRVD